MDGQFKEKRLMYDAAAKAHFKECLLTYPEGDRNGMWAGDLNVVRRKRGYP
jgi:hypothetical protein